MEKSYLQFLEGNYEKALSLCEEVINDKIIDLRDPEFSVQISCKYLLGQIYSQLHRYQEASEIYRSLEQQYKKKDDKDIDINVNQYGNKDYTSQLVMAHDLYTNLYASLIANNQAVEALTDYRLVKSTKAMNIDEDNDDILDNEDILESGYELYLNIALACIESQNYEDSSSYLMKASSILMENKEVEDWDDDRYSEELATLNLVFSYFYFLTGEDKKAKEILNFSRSRSTNDSPLS